MRLRVEKLSGPEALSEIEAEWDELDRRIFPRTPFTSALWIKLWWRHLRRKRLFVRDDFFCHVVRDSDGRLVAVAPFMLTRSPGFGPTALRLVQFFGADPFITEVRGVICEEADEPEVIQALTAHFQLRPHAWDLFKWRGLRRAAPEYSGLFPGNDVSADGATPDYVLNLPHDWSKLWTAVSDNMRKNIRKAYEFLERDGHRYELSASSSEPRTSRPRSSDFSRCTPCAPTPPT